MATTSHSKFVLLEYALILFTLPFILFFTFYHQEYQAQVSTSLLPLNEWLHPIVSKSLSLLSFFAFLWVVNSINQQYKFAEYASRSMLAIAFFFAFLFPSFFFQIENGLALLCMSLVVYFLLQAHNQKAIGGLLFLVGLFLSTATLFKASIIWFLITLITSLFILRPFRLKEHLITLTAYAIPFFYLYGIAYIFDWQLNHLNLHLSINSFNSSPFHFQIAYAWLIVLAAASIFYSLSYRSKMIVRSRKQLTVLLLVFLTAFILASFSADRDLHLLIMVLPLSIFYAILHKRIPKSWIVDLLSLLFVIIVILGYFGISLF